MVVDERSQLHMHSCWLVYVLFDNNSVCSHVWCLDLTERFGYIKESYLQTEILTLPLFSTLFFPPIFYAMSHPNIPFSFPPICLCDGWRRSMVEEIRSMSVSDFLVARVSGHMDVIFCLERMLRLSIFVWEALYLNIANKH